VCSQLLEAASIFEVCDLSCTELLERVERAGPSSDLVEYLHTFADELIIKIINILECAYDLTYHENIKHEHSPHSRLPK
jgi:hypothetical protein